MSKSAVLLLVLIFLTAFCLALTPAFSSEPIKENSWTPKSSMQVARSFLGVAVVNGKIYAIGGLADDGVVGTNEEYDPATDTWTFKKSMPTPRESFAIVSCQDKIYCIGGSTDAQSESITGVTEVYDPATDTWETKASLPNLRSSVKAHALDGKIYIIGGYVLNYSSYNYFYVALNDVYDPVTDTWTTLASMPNAVASRLSAVVNDKIYFLMVKPNSHQIYDAANDSWNLSGTSVPDFSMLYVDACATDGVDAPKRIYVVGDGGMLVYDAVNDEWTTGAAMLTDREAFGVAVVNDRVYAIGGFTGTNDMFWNIDITNYATVEQYTPFGYGTVSPEITVVSPETSGTYVSGDVSLAFALNKPVSWIGYSLDGQDNVTATGNTTLSGLPGGLHNVTVYVRDEFGNTDASETASFTVTEPFPTMLVATVSVASVAIIGIGLLVYFKKRKRVTDRETDSE